MATRKENDEKIRKIKRPALNKHKKKDEDKKKDESKKIKEDEKNANIQIKREEKKIRKDTKKGEGKQKEKCTKKVKDRKKEAFIRKQEDPKMVSVKSQVDIKGAIENKEDDKENADPKTRGRRRGEKMSKTELMKIERESRKQAKIEAKRLEAEAAKEFSRIVAQREARKRKQKWRQIEKFRKLELGREGNTTEESESDEEQNISLPEINVKPSNFAKGGSVWRSDCSELKNYNRKDDGKEKNKKMNSFSEIMLSLDKEVIEREEKRSYVKKGGYAGRSRDESVGKNEGHSTKGQRVKADDGKLEAKKMHEFSEKLLQKNDREREGRRRKEYKRRQETRHAVTQCKRRKESVTSGELNNKEEPPRKQPESSANGPRQASRSRGAKKAPPPPKVIKIFDSADGNAADAGKDPEYHDGLNWNCGLGF